MRQYSCCALVAAAMLFAASTAHAQSMPWINPAHVQTYSRMDPTSQLMADLQARDRQATRSTSIDAMADAAERSASVDCSFAYRADRTPQNLRNFLMRTPDPAARANLEQMFSAQPTLMDDISGAVRGYGFDPHNVADAYAAWWINVWGASQKQNIEPDAALVAAVKQQARNAFAATPDFAKTSDADRQEYAEALLLQATILGSALEQWKNDPKMLGQLAEAARKGAKASGLDLSLMTLTPGGFVPRKGADASEAVDGDETALAAAEGGDSTGIALAAGAGLGITLLGGFALMRRG